MSDEEQTCNCTASMADATCPDHGVLAFLIGLQLLIEDEPTEAPKEWAE